jgi:hypothetical protein
MLRIRFAPKATPRGILHVPVARIHLGAVGEQPVGASILCRIDTGADRSVVPISFARLVGLDKTTVRGTGVPWRATLANGATCVGYALEVEMRLEADAGGWMQWRGELGFLEAPDARNLLGIAGFLTYFNRTAFHMVANADGSSRGGWTELDPRDPAPGESISWGVGSEV